MDEKKRIREFLRLLSRSEDLDDIALIKNNIGELSRQYTELFEDNLIPPQKEKEYMTRIRHIQDKMNPKVAQSKPKPLIDKRNPDINDEQSIAEERKKHTEIMNKMLTLTSQLKDNAGKISFKMADDEEVLKTASDNLETLVNGAQQTNDHLNITKSERLGWRSYIEFLFFIGVYVIITIVF